ncbi:acylphosphatase [Levilactobacillus yonginensis]|uniref:acylphosphatase n=1 Tax=Levilactobacillus yonginensis TaxID=1054041 RepID=UPI000F7A3A49|nr:acylphosphatase [Levilactobacillus yonginensis]
MQTQKLIISGLVQGVGFRWSAAKVAQQLGVTGTVRNCSNGQVEVLATGDSHQLVDFQTQLNHGLAPWISVQAIDVTDLPLHHFNGFQIIA